MTIATITPEVVIPVVASFDAKGLAQAISNVKNRSVQVVEIGRARDRDGYSASEVAAFVNGYLDADEHVTAARFGDGAIKNLVATYRFLQQWDIIEGADKISAAHDKVIAKALNVIEKGQSTAVTETAAAIDALDPEDKRYLADVLDALQVGNKRALELRKNPTPAAIESGDDEGDESEDGTPAIEPVKAADSLVSVIIRSLNNLDYAGITADEQSALVEALELHLGRAITEGARFVADAA